MKSKFLLIAVALTSTTAALVMCVVFVVVPWINYDLESELCKAAGDFVHGPATVEALLKRGANPRGSAACGSPLM